MTTLLHIGDIHLKRRAQAKENRRFAGLMEWVQRRYDGGAKPLLVFSGDLTDNGHEDEYEHALAILAPLRRAGFTMVAAPGNHDVGPLGNSFYASRQNNFQRRVLGELVGVASARTGVNHMAELYPFVHDADDCLLVAVDSCHTEEHLASGDVGATQLAALDRVLAAATKPVVVVLHHHPFMRDRAMALNDRDAFMRCIDGRVRVLLFGHRHVAEVWRGDARWRIPLIIAAGKTSKPNRRDKTYELREIKVDAGRPTTTPIKVRL